MSDSTMFLVATISFRAVDKGSMFNSGAHTTRCPACAQYGTTYGPERGRARQSRQSRNQIVLVVVLRPRNRRSSIEDEEENLRSLANLRGRSLADALSQEIEIAAKLLF